MNIFTHIAIGIRTKRALEDMLPVKLKTFGFLLGSIKPDISRSYRKIPHYKDESIEFVKRNIEKLINSDNDDYLENEGEYAEKLGILTHYLSDYFCYAHSKRFNGGIIKHNYYEMKLMLYCAARFGRVFCPEKYIADEAARSFPEICSLIGKLHEKYSCSSACPSLAEDMAYTHEACLALCLTVLLPHAARRAAAQGSPRLSYSR